MSEHLEHEVANHNNLIRDLAEKVGKLERSPGGVFLPAAIPGPGNVAISRVEFNRMRDGMVSEIEALKAELAKVSDIATEAVRILDRIAGMGE